MGHLVFSNEFLVSIELISVHSSESWILTNLYVPPRAEDKGRFLDWFSKIQMPHDKDWLIVRDFNFIRAPLDRNKPGGSVHEMFFSLMRS